MIQYTGAAEPKTAQNSITTQNNSIGAAGGRAMVSTQATKLTLGRTSDGYVVCVEGRGTMRESHALHAVGCSCLEDDRQAKLTVDLSGCDYVDSTFLGCLVSLHKRGSRAGAGRLVIAAPEVRRSSLFSASRFEQFFQQVDVSPRAINQPLSICPAAADARALGRHIMECHRQLAQIEGPDQSAFARVVERLARELGDDQKPSMG